MNIILSKNNSSLMHARKLLMGKYRNEYGEYLIEGAKLVSEAVKYNQNIQKVFVLTQAQEKLQELVDKLECEVYFVDEKVFSTITDTVTSQGIIAVVKRQAQKYSTSKKGLVLCGLQDAGNVGTILRTAAATNYTDVYLINTVDVFSPKCLRSGMSAQFVLNFFYKSIDEIIAENKEKQLVCCNMDGIDVFEANVDQNHLLFLGSEGQGLPQEIINSCDVQIKLSMENNLESLNVAVSAGVVMYVLGQKAAKNKFKSFKQGDKKCPDTANGQILSTARQKAMRLGEKYLQKSDEK